MTRGEGNSVNRSIDFDTDRMMLEFRLELMQGVLHSMSHFVQSLAVTEARTKVALSREISDTRKVDSILLDLDHVSRALSDHLDTMHNLLRQHSQPTEASLGEVVENTIELFQHVAASRRLTITLKSTGDGICVRAPVQLALSLLISVLLHLDARRSGNGLVITIARTSLESLRVQIYHPFKGLAAYLIRSGEARRDKRIALDIQMAKQVIASIDGSVEVIDCPERSSLLITLPGRKASR